MKTRVTIAAGFILFCQALFAADLVRERRIADQILDGIIDGETVMLETDGHEFLGIFMEAELDEIRGSVIVLHGKGANPDWHEIVQPLRTHLPSHGWDTLSIQLPVAASDASEADWSGVVSEAAPRIKAALEYLEGKNRLNVVLVAHSMGVAMAMDFLGRDPDSVQALVAIGTPDMPIVYDTLRKLTIPVMDLYGADDFPEVKKATKKRKKAARKAPNPRFIQVEVNNADHFFTGQEEMLEARVRSWLYRYVTGTEIR